MLNLNQDDIGLNNGHNKLILPKIKDGELSEQNSDNLPSFLDNPKMKLGDDKLIDGVS